MITNTRKPMNRFRERFFMKLTHSSDESSYYFKLTNDKCVVDFETLLKSKLTLIKTVDPKIKLFVMPKILLSTEINGIQECRRATSILREHKQFYKIKKDKYELLCEEVIKNIELLEEGHNNNLSKERLINNSNNKKITPIQFEIRFEGEC
ncbi:hypothetical protein H8356DRAFT_1354031 [Neocallimastix lanati (nom. inval.)]|nr:hypothetical protein H8356DRAFT_1354031 [Neocallimastix sp. JGI-2020a]